MDLSEEILRSSDVVKYAQAKYFIDKGETGDLYGPFIWTSTNQKCILKHTGCACYRFSAKDFDYIKEKRFLRLSHQNVLTILDAFIITNSNGRFISDIVAEYAEGKSLINVLRLKDDLNDYHPDLLKTPLDANVTRNWLLQIAKGFEYLHANDIVPEVLTSHYVLLMQSIGILPNVLKINIFPEGKPRASRTICGTTKHKFAWLAPEQCRGIVNKKSHVWNYGVMIWEMQSRQDPQMGEKFGDVISRITSRYSSRLNIEKTWSYIFKELFKSCCSFETDDRPTFSDIIRTLTS